MFNEEFIPGQIVEIISYEDVYIVNEHVLCTHALFVVTITYD